MTSYKIIKLFKSKGFEFSGITQDIFKKYNKEFLKTRSAIFFRATWFRFKREQLFSERWQVKIVSFDK